MAVADYLDADAEHLSTISQIEQGGSTLDLDKRRMIGGSLRVVLQETDAGDLEDLFTPRAFRTTYLTSTIAKATAMTGAGTISVKHNGGLADSGLVYIGGETFSYTGKSSTTGLTGVTRALYGSIAQVHFGSSTNGDGVYEQPPSWYGRRVYLYGSYLNDDGTTTTDLTSQIGTFRLESAPQYLGDGLWQIDCSELSDEYAAKKIYSGIREVDIDPETAISTGATGLLQVPMNDTTQFTTSNLFNTYAMMRLDSSNERHKTDIREIDSSTSTVVKLKRKSLVRPRPNVSSVTALPFTAASYTQGVIKSLRHIAILSSHAGGDLMRMLVSINGDASNGLYDQLPGQTRTALGGDTEFRFGAAIDADDVDSTSIVEIGREATGWSYVLDAETDAGAVLRDFCVATQSFWYVDASGVLTVARLAQARASSVITLSSSNTVEPPSLTFDEESITPRMKASTNYDPITGTYRGTVSIVDNELSARYHNRDDTTEIESRAVVLDQERFIGGPRVVRPATPLDSFIVAMRRVQLSGGRGRLVATIKATFPAFVVDLGDVVTLDFSDTPDMAGGTLSSKLGRVIGRRPHFDSGIVDLDVQVLDTLLHVAPAARIASTAGTPAVLTLATDTATYPELTSATPGNSFGVGWPVLVFDVSANASYAHTIASVTSTTITLSAALGFALEANVDFITLDERALSVAVAAESSTGLGTSDFLYQVDDSGFFADTVDPTRFI